MVHLGWNTIGCLMFTGLITCIIGIVGAIIGVIYFIMNLI